MTTLKRESPSSSLHFFPKLWAVNVSWHDVPERRIDSYAVPKGAMVGTENAP